MRQTWGERVIGNFSFGLIFTLFSLPLLPFVLVLTKTWGTPSFLPIFAAAIVYLIVLGIFQSALQTIFNAVMNVFARDGKVPEGFSAEQLKEVMRQL